MRKAVRGSPAFRQILRCDGVWENVHERSVLGVAATGDSIVTASEDCTVKILDAADGSCRAILEGHTGRVRCVCIMPDGRIVSGSRDEKLIVWAPDGSHLRTLHEHTDYVWCVAALPEDRVASGSKDGCIHIWDVNTGHHLSGIYVNGAVRCLAVLPDGTVIADGGDGRLKLWDVTKGACIGWMGPLDGPREESITSVAVVDWGSSSSWLTFEGVFVVGRENGSLTLWNPILDEMNNITFPGSHGAAVWALASLPNKRVVAADGDGVLKVWRADIPSLALACLQTLRGHARAAFCLATLPDGRIVSGSMDRTLRFWAPVGTQIDRGARDAPSRVS